MSVFVESVAADIRYAARTMLRMPGFLVVAVGAVALGVGPATAVFSIVDRLLFRPLPYAHDAQLVSTGMMAPLDANEFMFAGDYFNLQRDHGPFEAVTAFQAGAFDCDIATENPQRARCMRVERNFLEVLGIAPAAGRAFTEEEDVPNGPRVVLISSRLWKSRFGGDPRAAGRAIEIDGASHEITGILPPDFEMPTLTETDILMPLALRSTERSGRALRVFATLKPGVTVEQARERLGAHFAEALKGVPPQFRKEVSFRVRSLRDRQVSDVRLASFALFGSVLAVLLIACANVATLLVARAVSRDREMAMRTALGASRWRIARQVLTESLMLGLAGGVAGVALAWALLRSTVALAPAGLPRIEQASLDGRVLGFALAAAVGSSLIFGAAPALRKWGTGLIGGLRSTAWSGGLRGALVTVQIAVSIVLLVGAGLLLRSLWNLQQVPLGMDAGRVVTARFVLGKARFSQDRQQIAFFSELEQRLKALPGVEAAAVSDSLPPSGGARGRPLSTIEVEGRVRRPEGTGGMVVWRFVSPGYFAALGIPIRKGRGFIEQDREMGTNSIVLSEAAARMMFPGEDPVERRVLKTREGAWHTVVGVAGDVKNGGPAKETGPEYYVVRKTGRDDTYANQEPPVGWRAAAAVVRTAIDPRLVASSIRATFAEMDRSLPVDIETMRERAEGSYQRPRFNALMLATLAAIGLLLAVLGLYGVVAFLASQRRQEIGVRMALGATPGRVLVLVLGYAARLTALGVVLGLAGALSLTQLLRKMLFGVSDKDPLTMIAVLVVLAAACLVAVWIPSRRASRVDPAVALRHD